MYLQRRGRSFDATAVTRATGRLATSHSGASPPLPRRADPMPELMAVAMLRRAVLRPCPRRPVASRRPRPSRKTRVWKGGHARGNRRDHRFVCLRGSARRKLSRARVIIFVRSAPSRTASGHARSSAPDSRSCRKRQRRWTSRRRAPLRHYRRRIGRALPLPPTDCRLLPQMGSREAERCRNSPRDCARACTASR